VNPAKDSLENKSSFYYPLLLLPREKQQAMKVLYHFCWQADEISDGPGSPQEKKRRLSRFRQNLRLAFQNRAREPLFQKLQGMIRYLGLSREPLERILQGVERDLKSVRFAKFSELHRYALQVAGGPGLASMELFGFKDRAHRDYAENLGIFLQLVNITRDFKEDLALKRLYFPLEDFKRFHLDPSQIGKRESHWKPFVEFQLDRAWSFLEKARRSLTLSQRARLMTAEAIAAIYVKLFQKLKAQPHRILLGRTALTRADKLLAVAAAVARCYLWNWKLGSK
jgi:15-cis-phytoene synthase